MTSALTAGAPDGDVYKVRVIAHDALRPTAARCLASLRRLVLTPVLVLSRTYASWAHQKGVPGKVVAELMGHEKVDTSVNVYTQVIDGAKLAAAQQVGGELKSELITIDHAGQGAQESTL